MAVSPFFSKIIHMLLNINRMEPGYILEYQRFGSGIIRNVVVFEDAMVAMHRYLEDKKLAYEAGYISGEIHAMVYRIKPWGDFNFRLQLLRNIVNYLQAVGGGLIDFRADGQKVIRYVSKDPFIYSKTGSSPLFDGFLESITSYLFGKKTEFSYKLENNKMYATLRITDEEPETRVPDWLILKYTALNKYSPRPSPFFESHPFSSLLEVKGFSGTMPFYTLDNLRVGFADVILLQGLETAIKSSKNRKSAQKEIVNTIGPVLSKYVTDVAPPPKWLSGFGFGHLKVSKDQIQFFGFPWSQYYETSPEIYLRALIQITMRKRFSEIRKSYSPYGIPVTTVIF